MKKLAVGIWLMAAIGFGAEYPPSGPEKILFHTVVGDFVIVLYPTVAPQNVSQVLELARKGAYDSTHFVRIEPTFVAQISTARDRLVPLTAPQTALLRKIPLEVTPDLKHHAWDISMAHEDGDVHSAESSFSVLLTDAPHLDGKYSIVGRVERGFDVIQAMLRVSRGSTSRPRTRLTVLSAEVIPASRDIASMPMVPAMAIQETPESMDPRFLAIRDTASWGLLGIILISLCAFFFRSRLNAGHLTSLALLQVLVSVFLLLTLQVDTKGAATPVAVVLFFGLLAMFKLLNRFESYPS